MAVVLNHPKVVLGKESLVSAASNKRLQEFLLNEYALAVLADEPDESDTTMQFRTGYTGFEFYYSLNQNTESTNSKKKLSSLRTLIKNKMSNDDIEKEMQKLRDEWQRDI